MERTQAIVVSQAYSPQSRPLLPALGPRLPEAHYAARVSSFFAASAVAWLAKERQRRPLFTQWRHTPPPRSFFSLFFKRTKNAPPVAVLAAALLPHALACAQQRITTVLCVCLGRLRLPWPHVGLRIGGAKAALAGARLRRRSFPSLTVETRGQSQGRPLLWSLAQLQVGSEAGRRWFMVYGGQEG